ncbi:MAG: phosphate ABC transporter permease PstA [Gammaproteobacteria bacterium]|nr:phosphate ABC transporter permease PstA [Pseudomonadales bacterium]MCP5345756.1 phosphate ABC transporter permease PstA [Pseudomonadales bacterium]
MKQRFKRWIQSGSPWIWFNAGAVAISVVMVVGLLMLLAVRGMVHFWPSDVVRASYTVPTASGEQQTVRVMGEIVDTETIPASQIIASGIPVEERTSGYQRTLMKLGNRDLTGADFRWVLNDFIHDMDSPAHAVVLERFEWGNFYGFLTGIQEAGEAVLSTAGGSDDEALWEGFNLRLERALQLHEQIATLEKDEIGRINYQVERLRLAGRRLELSGDDTPAAMADLEQQRDVLNREYDAMQAQLVELYNQVNRDTANFETVDGQQTGISLADVVRAYRPNAVGLFSKLGIYFSKLWEFLSQEPREANTEGGIYPAIFGTVMMVMLMSIFVTPFGVVAAVYLREYAKQGVLTRTIRIAVNNLAGVPSIVYGVFGLGFFIYFVGAEIDQVFYPEALPAPTFGTPGLLWASLTLALLTVPVVIVATEEGLARIPRSVREGSLALGATKFETLWRVVLPMASPAMMTGLILAVARAAGEVAPLMLVGVVKLAPSLPLDGNYPYLHLDQKFMHLGFHIYDVGFQSPNVEAARPLVYATALLLVAVIAILNLSAVAIRNRLRERYKSLDM